MALDLVSDVNQLASSKLFGKSVLVQLHLSIIILSEVSAGYYSCYFYSCAVLHHLYLHG